MIPLHAMAGSHLYSRLPVNRLVVDFPQFITMSYGIQWCHQEGGWHSEIKCNQSTSNPIENQNISWAESRPIRCQGVLPSSTWTPRCAWWQKSTKASRSWLCRVTTSPPFLQVEAWWPRGSNAVVGQRGQGSPLDVFNPSHHLIPTQNSWGSMCKPSSTLGTTESQEDACEADAERRRALLAGDEESKRALNCSVSILKDRAFWGPQ